MHSYINELGALVRSTAENFGKQRRGVAIFAAFAAVVVFTITTSGLTINAADDVIATITIPESVSITAGSDARDRWNAAIEVTGGTIAIGSPGDSITVPIVVPGGWRLESLTDPTTGITIVRNDNGAVLRIPIRDADGNDTIRVLVNTTDYIGDGWQATATINSMSIDLPTRSRDFSEVDAEVGVASVKILGAITGFPGNSAMNMSIAKSADDEVSRIVEVLAADHELEVADVAYVVGLEKTNLDPVLGEMTLRLTVGKQWADKYGLENVRVVRIADDGSTQVFDWIALDANADPVQFNLVSPNGLSKFVIEALRKAQATPTPTITPSPTSIPTAVPTATEVPTSNPPPTATATAASLSPTAATTSPVAAFSPTRVPDPTPTAIPPTAEPTRIPMPTSEPISETVLATSESPDDTTGAVSGDSEQIASGSSCNAVIPSGSMGIGQLAFLLSPLGLIVYKKRIRG